MFMLSFILLFMLFLVVSSFTIVGWYNVTRGRWETQPDGTKKWVGKIFNFWGKFLQQHTETIEYYENEEFLKEFAKIRDFFKDDDIHEFAKNGVIAKTMNPKKAAYLFIYALRAGVNISLTEQEEKEGHKGGTSVTIYKEIYNYKIPYLLRYPLGECLSCCASFYGTICWLFFYNILVQLQAVPEGLTLFSKIGLWAVFILALSYLNELVFNINHSKSK